MTEIFSKFSRREFFPLCDFRILFQYGPWLRLTSCLGLLKVQVLKVSHLLHYRKSAKMGKGDPKKPRGKMSSYAFFVQTCREEHKKKHPDASVNFSEFSKKCSERWKVGIGA